MPSLVIRMCASLKNVPSSSYFPYSLFPTQNLSLSWNLCLLQNLFKTLLWKVCQWVSLKLLFIFNFRIDDLNFHLLQLRSNLAHHNQRLWFNLKFTWLKSLKSWSYKKKHFSLKKSFNPKIIKSTTKLYKVLLNLTL